MYRYAQIELAIARLHFDVTPENLKYFRGRLRNLQRVGLVTSSPGKGQKKSYTSEDAAFWAICFELVELALPPIIIKQILDAQWKSLSDFFGENQIGGEIYYFLVTSSYMLWSTNENVAAAFAKHASGIRTKRDLIEGGIIDNQRLILINLSCLKSKLFQQLYRVPEKGD